MSGMKFYSPNNQLRQLNGELNGILNQIISLNNHRSDKHQKIRVSQWIMKLRETTTNIVWKQNILLYAIILLAMVKMDKIDFPFLKIPDSCQLPRLSKYDIPYYIWGKISIPQVHTDFKRQKQSKEMNPKKVLNLFLDLKKVIPSPLSSLSSRGRNNTQINKEQNFISPILSPTLSEIKCTSDFDVQIHEAIIDSHIQIQTHESLQLKLKSLLLKSPQVLKTSYNKINSDYYNNDGLFFLDKGKDQRQKEKNNDYNCINKKYSSLRASFSRESYNDCKENLESRISDADLQRKNFAEFLDNAINKRKSLRKQ